MPYRRNRLVPHPQTAEKAALWGDKSAGIGGRAGVGRPMRAAWMIWVGVELLAFAVLLFWRVPLPVRHAS